MSLSFPAELNKRMILGGLACFRGDLAALGVSFPPLGDHRDFPGAHLDVDLAAAEKGGVHSKNATTPARQAPWAPVCDACCQPLRTWRTRDRDCPVVQPSAEFTRGEARPRPSREGTTMDAGYSWVGAWRSDEPVEVDSSCRISALGKETPYGDTAC